MTEEKKMNVLASWIALVGGLGMLAGCNGAVQEGGGAGAPVDEAGESPVVQPSAPVVREDTLLIEGMPEVVRVQRVEAPAAFPLEFTTDVPLDMRVVPQDDPVEGDEAIRFEAAFGGRITPEAFLQFAVLPASVDSAGAADLAISMSNRLGATREDSRRFDWSLAEYRLTGERSGFIALGMTDGRWFYFLGSYPPEFGDGMGARIGYVLDSWRWAEGEPL